MLEIDLFPNEGPIDGCEIDGRLQLKPSRPIRALRSPRGSPRPCRRASRVGYLCTLLDGCSRYVVHWEIKESMTEAEVEIVVQRAREKFPGVTPRIISDNGPQFIAKD
ncbi:MAG: transposase family protein, partial [Planctomycetota bacterium]